MTGEMGGLGQRLWCLFHHVTWKTVGAEMAEQRSQVEEHVRRSCDQRLSCGGELRAKVRPGVWGLKVQLRTLGLPQGIRQPCLFSKTHWTDKKLGKGKTGN